MIMWMSSVLDTEIFPIMTNDHCLAIVNVVYMSTRSHVQETAAPASSTSVVVALVQRSVLCTILLLKDAYQGALQLEILQEDMLALGGKEVPPTHALMQIINNLIMIHTQQAKQDGCRTFQTLLHWWKRDVCWTL